MLYAIHVSSLGGVFCEDVPNPDCYKDWGERVYFVESPSLSAVFETAEYREALEVGFRIQDEIDHLGGRGAGALVDGIVEQHGVAAGRERLADAAGCEPGVAGWEFSGGDALLDEAGDLTVEPALETLDDAPLFFHRNAHQLMKVAFLHH